MRPPQTSKKEKTQIQKSWGRAGGGYDYPMNEQVNSPQNPEGGAGGEGEREDVRVTDLFRPSIPRVSRLVRKERMDICRTCDHFSTATQRCGVCGCVMPLKTTLGPASCPIDKWGPA
jgi:hypothetical protein